MERQLSSRLDRIRPDHVNRYRFASRYISQGESVIDAACGCGYGTWILWSGDYLEKDVTGIDVSSHAIEYARKNWPGPKYLCADLQIVDIPQCDVIVSFETIEHLHNPENILRKFRKSSKRLFISTPNEERFPFDPDKFKNDEYPHLRHYTDTSFTELLEDTGWMVKQVFCQRDKRSDVTPGSDGMFMVFEAE